MGLFDWFGKLAFFKGRNTEGITEEDLDFDKWIQAHRDWRHRLTHYISGTGPDTLSEEATCRDDHCALGQWIYGNGGRLYGDLEIFRNMRHHHAQFHSSAGRVIRCFKTEGAAAARKTLQNDFDRHSLLVVALLQSLESMVRH